MKFTCQFVALVIAILALPAFASAAEIPATESSAVATGTPEVFDFQSKIDTDADGLPDTWELSIFKTDPMKKDTDGDGFSDGVEIRDGYDPVKPKKALLPQTDSDTDGLDNRLEFLFNANPTIGDTDGDGYSDGKEIATGFSPTSADNTPLEKKISITLSKQVLKQQLGGVTLATFRVSTGKPGMTTPVGDYKVLEKSPKAWSRAAKLWMPYWMKFTNRGHGIHELPEWPGGKKEGANHLGIAVSHGCVRLGIGPAKTMYDWAEVGTAIHIER